ncbi:MAG: hypothetical protein ABJL55_05345 [Roseibium sp.]
MHKYNTAAFSSETQKKEHFSSKEAVFNSLVVQPVLEERQSREIADEVICLTKLPKGWDGYRGVPVKPQNAWFALDLIKSLCALGVSKPHVVPGSGGEVQLEWHTKEQDVELLVNEPYKVSAYRFEVETEEEEEIDLTVQYSKVVEWFNDIKI